MCWKTAWSRAQESWGAEAGATGEPHSGQAGRIQEIVLPVRAQGD